MTKWDALRETIEGDVLDDRIHQMMYATDASIYRERPQAVAFPKSTEDLSAIVAFCQKENIPIIPRSAGTSLAGQVVGDGLIVDVSRYMNQVISIDEEKREARVQPGVIRDDLNRRLKPLGLCFGPNTSTSNRATIGGMAGNNSSGTTSIYYGHTRDKVKAMKTVLSDGSVFEWSADAAVSANPLAENISSFFDRLLDKKENRELISEQFPDASIPRRNSGYALDELARMEPYQADGPPFNMCALLCGSEGTLALTSELVVTLDVLPPHERLMLCLEFDDVVQSLRAVQTIMTYHPYQCELMDDTILNCARENPMYGPIAEHFSPGVRSILMVEWAFYNAEEEGAFMTVLIEQIQKSFQAQRHHMFYGEEIEKVWNLRKAGLGLLANVPGDTNAIACIEDTAVALDVLPEYIAEFDALMQSYNQRPVYYAHAGAGELHLRPLLNLKDQKDVEEFEKICQASADLVFKYKGSISGEHGDGRVRAPFLEQMYGPTIYQWFLEIKDVWDPNVIFNPGKIIRAKPLSEDLRYSQGQRLEVGKTAIRFDQEGGLLRAAEKCNGSGDCRKSPEDGGAMCPSYHATRNEMHTTRGRANVLREILTQEKEAGLFSHAELKESLDLCLACKACYKECPSEVDMASMRAAFLSKYYEENRRPLRDYLFTKMTEIPDLLRPVMRKVFEWTPKFFMDGIQGMLGITTQRHLPLPEKGVGALRGLEWDEKSPIDVLIYQDELTRMYRPDLLVQCVDLLQRLGLKAYLSYPVNSARALISKGFLTKAKKHLENQLTHLQRAIKGDAQIIGLEPSGVLVWKHEAPRLVDKEKETLALEIGRACHTFSAWFYEWAQAHQLNPFTDDQIDVHIHGHCHFKALENEDHIYMGIGSLPGVHVHRIPSGCCGMAGSFGYEKEHFEVSKKVAEVSLLPYVEKLKEKDVVLVQGISCYHQLQDLSNCQPLHPVEWIHSRLKSHE